MKRKREPEQDEEEIVKEIKEKFSKINKKTKSNSTERGQNKMKRETEEHESFVKNEFLKSIEKNKQKVFQFICDEYPTFVPPYILLNVSIIELGMMKYLFEKKLVSKETRNFLNEDALMYWIKKSNVELVRYLLKVQKFDLLSKSAHAIHTRFSKKI
jgi:hypothetical protein